MQPGVLQGGEQLSTARSDAAHAGAQPGAGQPIPAQPIPALPMAGGSEPTSALVATALASLSSLAVLPLAEQPSVFARIHAHLQQALAEIDDA